MNPIDLLTAPIRLAGMAVGGALNVAGAVIAAPFQALGFFNPPPEEQVVVNIPTAEQMNDLRESVAARLENVEYGQSVPLGGHPGQMPDMSTGIDMGMPWSPPFTGPPPCNAFNSAATPPAPTQPEPLQPQLQQSTQPQIARRPTKGPGV